MLRLSSVSASLIDIFQSCHVWFPAGEVYLEERIL
jgi:hypothetical protein